MSELWFINIKLVITFFLVMSVFRLIGRKAFAEKTPLDTVFLVILGGVCSILVTGNQYTILETIGIILFWMLLIYLIDVLKTKYKTVRQLLNGTEKILIEDGKINHSLLISEKLTIDEVIARLREKGIFSIEEVEIAYLEISGEINAKRKRSEK